jgi:MATE family multidrug resistance protein
VSSSAKKLERVSREEERRKRGVAHSALVRTSRDRLEEPASATTATKTAYVVAEGRPQAASGAFLSVGQGRERRPQREVTREVFALAWPIAAAMLGETAIGLVDTKLVGGLGAGALGGVGLATTFMFLAYSMSFGGMRGVKVRVAHAIGEGNAHHGFAYARAGLVMGALFGAVMMVLCRDVGPLLLWTGTDPAIVPFATDFLAAVTLGAPATCALSALIQQRQAVGDSRTPMVVGITGNAFNAVLAWALIYGHLGLPALGVRGGGYATATTEMAELAVMYALFVRDERRSRREIADKGRPPVSFSRAAREVAELGVPTGIQFTAETLAFTAFTVVLGSISREEIAAHQVALNVIRVSFLPGVAVSEAASVLVGRALGSRRLDEADAAVKSALGIAVGFMAACGLLFALGGGVLGRFFSSDPVVIRVTQRLLLVAALFQILDAVNIVFRVALRGAKDVRAVAMIGVVVVWSFLPTCAYVLGRLCGLGALGGWIGFVGETTVGATLFWLRWKRGGWRRSYSAT